MEYKSGANTGGIIYISIKSKTFMTMEKQACTCISCKKNGASRFNFKVIFLLYFMNYPKLQFIPREDSIRVDSQSLKTNTVLDSVSATGNEFQRVGPEYIRPDLSKSNLGLGTLNFLE